MPFTHKFIGGVQFDPSVPVNASAGLPEGLATPGQGDGGYRVPPGGMSWEEHERILVDLVL